MTLSPRAVRPLIGGGEKRPLDGQFDEASFAIDYPSPDSESLSVIIN